MQNLSNLSREKLLAIAEAKRRGLSMAHLLNSLEKNSTFSEKYFANPKQFVHDCFIWKPGEQPTLYQDELLGELPRRKRVCGRGPHGLGKTTSNAWIILWFALTRDAAGYDWKVVTTAGAWRQLTKFLWPEVHKWARRLNWKTIGREAFSQHELLTLSLKLAHGEAFAVASDNSDLIEGAHATQLLYIFDESKAISEKTFDAAEGAFSNSGAGEGIEAFAVAMSTPGEPLGRFYDIQSKKAGFEDWWVRSVSFDEVVSAGRATWAWADQRKSQWGESSAIYQNKVMGRFASQDEQGVIPLAWVEAANERWLELKESGRLNELAQGNYDAIGCDVGDGGDETVIAKRLEETCLEINRYPRLDLMSTVGKVKAFLEAHGGTARIDVIGIGAGVVSRLRELQSEIRANWEVEPFHAAESASGKDQSGEMGFVNKRAEAWWQMRERLDPANGSQAALPPDDKLTGDLVAPRYKITSRGLYQIEAKDEIRKRLGRSTDTGDAVVMAFYQEQVTKGGRFWRG